jgi:hypothetical protein
LERLPGVAEVGVGRVCLSSKELIVGRHTVVVRAPAATHTTLEIARAWAATSPKAGNMSIGSKSMSLAGECKAMQETLQERCGLRSQSLPWQRSIHDPVAVGVGEIHRDRRPVVLRPTDRIASLHQALDCPGEFTAVGIEDGEVVQSRVPLRWRCAPLTVPGVQAYMVMVVPCGKKRCSWQAEVGSVGGQLEAKHVAVEAHRSIEVSDAQMHVSDAHRRVKL